MVERPKGNKVIIIGFHVFRAEHEDRQGNIQRVDRKKHEAWHTLFPGYMTAHQIVELNRYWIDPRYRVTIEPTERSTYKNLGSLKITSHARDLSF
ncbi:MAG: hypothetical protein R3B65_03020 [Candidatus Paceibacterota bacterium]